MFSSHRIALRNFLDLSNLEREQNYGRLLTVLAGVQRWLWSDERQRFRAHVYPTGKSPFSSAVDETEVYYHGGTIVAMAAGLLDRAQIKGALDQMARNAQAAGASSIGITQYPPYPAGTFKNPIIDAEYEYQNGGDWTWFGARVFPVLVISGLAKEAYPHLVPMIDRVIRHDGFYEWWTRDGQPRGSAEFRGAAGVLHKAIATFEKYE